VRYRETDAMGIAHHAEYLAWFEVGRTDWIRRAGPADEQGERSYRRLELAGFFLPVIELSARYRAPARYDDEVIVVTTLTSSSRIRIAFDYEVLRLPERTLLVRGSTVHAVTDHSGRPKRLPPATLAWLLGADGAADDGSDT
jgi:acyl-CoA thioester hydrolase